MNNETEKTDERKKAIHEACEKGGGEIQFNDLMGMFREWFPPEEGDCDPVDLEEE